MPECGVLKAADSVICTLHSDWLAVQGCSLQIMDYDTFICTEPLGQSQSAHQHHRPSAHLRKMSWTLIVASSHGISFSSTDGAALPGLNMVLSMG